MADQGSSSEDDMDYVASQKDSSSSGNESDNEEPRKHVYRTRRKAQQEQQEEQASAKKPKCTDDAKSEQQPTDDPEATQPQRHYVSITHKDSDEAWQGWYLEPKEDDQEKRTFFTALSRAEGFCNFFTASSRAVGGFGDCVQIKSIGSEEGEIEEKGSIADELREAVYDAQDIQYVRDKATNPDAVQLCTCEILKTFFERIECSDPAPKDVLKFVITTPCISKPTTPKVAQESPQTEADS